MKSNCCGAPPLGEVDSHNVGRCSKCKEGALFKVVKKVKSQSRQKIRYVFTVSREYEINSDKLNEEIEAFAGVKDEAGEYLYGGSSAPETITVEMHVQHGHEWQTIYGDPR